MEKPAEAPSALLLIYYTVINSSDVIYTRLVRSVKYFGECVIWNTSSFLYGHFLHSKSSHELCEGKRSQDEDEVQVTLLLVLETNSKWTRLKENSRRAHTQLRATRRGRKTHTHTQEREMFLSKNHKLVKVIKCRGEVKS